MLNIFFALLVELVLFILIFIYFLSEHLSNTGHNTLSEIVAQLWWFMTGVPFLFLNQYKKEIEKEHKAKKIAFELEHLADGVIGKKGIEEISFERIEAQKK